MPIKRRVEDVGRRNGKCQVLATVLNGLKRGVEDIFIACTDNLGFPVATGLYFPRRKFRIASSISCVIRANNNQRRNDETVNHGADASLLHAGEGGIQSDGSQCADHQELAGSLGAAHQLRRG